MDRNLVELREVLIRHCSACSELAKTMPCEYQCEYNDGRVAAFLTAICELDDILLNEYRNKQKGGDSK